MAERKTQPSTERFYRLHIDPEPTNRLFRFRFEPYEDKPPSEPLVLVPEQKNDRMKHKVTKPKIILWTALSTVFVITMANEHFFHKQSVSLLVRPQIVEPSPTVDFPVALPEQTNGVIYIATPGVAKTSIPTPGLTAFSTPLG